jgi:hypothetical protein
VQCLDGNISTLMNYFLYSVLIPVIMYYFIIIVWLLFSLFDFVYTRFFGSLLVIHKKIFSSNPGLNYFDPVIQEPSPSMQVNEHHTSDCTVFVLVLEGVAYYDHRHRGIYEINILQVVKQAEGKTLTVYLTLCLHFSFSPHPLTLCTRHGRIVLRGEAPDFFPHQHQIHQMFSSDCTCTCCTLSTEKSFRNVHNFSISVLKKFIIHFLNDFLSSKQPIWKYCCMNTYKAKTMKNRLLLIVLFSTVYPSF